MKIRDASIGLKELNKTTVRNYDAWTKASLLSEEKLKTLSGEILDINIDTIVNTQGYRVVGIFYYSDNTPVDGQLMGMPLVSPSKSAESEFLVDSMSLILYLARNLDKYSKHNDDRFFQMVKGKLLENNIFSTALRG